MPHLPPAAPFAIVTPREGALPVVFDSPHSAIEYPPDFVPAATPSAIRTTWDAYVDELFGDVPASGATLLAARFPRAYIDANRAVNDIDPELLATAWPGPVELSEHSRRGMGLIRRFALPGVPMYARRLSVAEVRARIDGCYAPYRRALADAIDRAHREHGFVWHFNCHSMKSRGNAMNRDRGTARPDFAIGDREGTTAVPAFTAWVAAFFEGLGYRVKINDPYRGADIVRAHGQPAQRRYSVQIEINRALYLDEATYERHDRFDALREGLAHFGRAVAERARAEMSRGVVA